MRAIQRTGNSATRTPVQLAKAAMKQRALADLSAIGLANTAKVIVEYQGVRHEIVATPTVTLETGQVLFHFGAVGNNRLPICENPTVGTVTFGLSGNIMTGLQIENHQQYLKQYGLSLSGSGESEAALSAGESTE